MPDIKHNEWGGIQPKMIECKKVSVNELGFIDNGTGKHQSNTVFGTDGIAPTITTILNGGTQQIKIVDQQIVAMRGRNPENPSDRSKGIELEQRLELNEQGICNTLTSVQKDNLVLEQKSIKIRQATKDGFIDCEVGGACCLSYPTSQLRRGRVIENGNISPTITTTDIPSVIEFGNPDFYNFLYEIDGEIYFIRIRKLVPRECWRLMSFSDEDFDKAEKVNSNTQLYKQAGNSIVVKVLEAIFRQMIESEEQC